MLYASVSWTAAFSAICTAVAAPLLNRASLTVGTLLEPSTKPRSSGLRSGIKQGAHLTHSRPWP